MTVACEPTGHRWRILGQLAAERGMAFVCVQPLISSWARAGKTSPATRPTRRRRHHRPLTAQLRCYVPEVVDETWGRLRHLGARRERLLTELTAQVQQIRDLLECVWPTALTAANYPFRSRTWMATMQVILERDGGDFTKTRRLAWPGWRSSSRRR